MPCLALTVVVDRVEEPIAVLEVGDTWLEVPWEPGLEEGATLRLCVAPSTLAARPAPAADPHALPSGPPPPPPAPPR